MTDWVGLGILRFAYWDMRRWVEGHHRFGEPISGRPRDVLRYIDAAWLFEVEE
jgi:hypothetical protein